MESLLCVPRGERHAAERQQRVGGGAVGHEVRLRRDLERAPGQLLASRQMSREGVEQTGRPERVDGIGRERRARALQRAAHPVPGAGGVTVVEQGPSLRGDRGDLAAGREPEAHDVGHIGGRRRSEPGEHPVGGLDDP